jgi:hypothetical protein
MIVGNKDAGNPMTLKQFADQYRLKLRRNPDDDTDIIPGREGFSHKGTAM